MSVPFDMAPEIELPAAGPPPLSLPGLGLEPPAPVATATDPGAALKELYGFDAFRPGQEAAVRAALEGRDVLVVMPTGSGKSLCYQLPALMRADLTLVVSPLVSLMTDQVQALERIAPGRVGVINSQQDAAANRHTLERAVSGHLRLLYVAPERFSSLPFLKRIREARIGLFIVDEAHCVSQWGHDFRPDYFRLADAARWLGAESIVASTATATPQVASDIVARLGLRDAAHVSTGFDRPNLSFSVVPCTNKESAHRNITQVLSDPAARPAIVYAGTRADCDRLSQRLGRDLGVPVGSYHAGLPRDQRAESQRRFMEDETPVVVATNAFGMGVDKANVRTVCHETVPGSIEAYYQEAGRAGRDGAPARCLLFACSKDKGLHVFFIQRSEVKPDQLVKVARRLTLEESFDVALREFGSDPAEHDAVRAIAGHLARAGVIRPSPSPPDRLIGRVVGAWDARAMSLCRAAGEEASRVRWRQYRAVWSWVEDRKCRRRGILRHFGDTSSPAPDNACCDVCDPQSEPVFATARQRQSGPRKPQLAHRPVGDGESEALDEAIFDVVSSAEPPVGRTRAVEVLRGGRSKVIAQNSYDGLPHYGTFGHLSGPAVLERVDALLQAGSLRSTGGRFPKLEVT